MFNKTSMKFIYILLIILFSLSVYAGQTYYLESLSTTPEQSIRFGLGDRIEFEMLDGKHTIILDAIKLENGFIELDIFPYINQDPSDRQVAYVNIDKTRFATLDLNRDYINDLEIRLISLDENSAFLKFNKINKPIFPENQKPAINPVKDLENKKENIIIPIAITILVFAIMFIIYLLIFKRSKTEWLSFQKDTF